MLVTGWVMISRASRGGTTVSRRAVISRLLDRREPRFAHRRRGGRRVPAAAEARGDGAGIDRADAAAPDHVDPRAHAHHDKNGAEVLHLAQLAGEDRKIADVAGTRGRGHPDLDAPDRVPPQGAQQVVEEQHLLGREVAGDLVRHDVEIRPLFEQPRRGLQIAGRRRGEGQRAGVLVDAQRQQRRLLGGEGVAAPAQELDHQRGVRADLLDHLDDPGDVLGARGVVVVDVHFHAGPGGDLGERADAVAPPGVDENDPGDLRRIERAQPRHPVAARRGLEILAQRPLLRAGEDELRPRVELLRRDHRGEGVELGLQVGGDDLHLPLHPRKSQPLRLETCRSRAGCGVLTLRTSIVLAALRRWRPPLRATPRARASGPFPAALLQCKFLDRYDLRFYDSTRHVPPQENPATGATPALRDRRPGGRALLPAAGPGRGPRPGRPRRAAETTAGREPVRALQGHRADRGSRDAGRHSRPRRLLPGRGAALDGGAPGLPAQGGRDSRAARGPARAQRRHGALRRLHPRGDPRGAGGSGARPAARPARTPKSASTSPTRSA